VSITSYKSLVTSVNDLVRGNELHRGVAGLGRELGKLKANIYLLILHKKQKAGPKHNTLVEHQKDTCMSELDTMPERQPLVVSSVMLACLCRILACMHVNVGCY
jgi:hypothetical protein